MGSGELDIASTSYGYLRLFARFILLLHSYEGGNDRDKGETSHDRRGDAGVASPSSLGDAPLRVRSYPFRFAGLDERPLQRVQVI